MKHRVGNCVYKDEILELKKRLGARGIVLLVIGGNRNVDDVEISSIVPAGEVPFTAAAMLVTAVKMRHDITPFVSGTIVE